MKKIIGQFIVLSLLFTAPSFAKVADTLFVGKLADARLYAGNYLSTIITDYGGGTFIYDSADITTSDNTGTVFVTADGKRFKRLFDNGIVNIQWFGAVADWNGSSGTDNTKAIQAAINYARSNLYKVYNVFIPAGRYMTDRLLLPYGIKLYGVGGVMESADRAGSRLFLKPSSNRDLIRFIPNIDAASNGKFWQGAIHDLELYGSATSDSSWCINLVDTLGASITPQDLCEINHLVIRNFKSGGLHFPQAGLPLFLSDVKIFFNAGPGILFEQTGLANDYRNQASSFINISGDGNNGGLIKLKNLSRFGSVTIFNVKSESRENVTFNTGRSQTNAIIIENCDSTAIKIIGGTHISSYKPAGADSIMKPGSFIKVIGSDYPILEWDNLVVRVRLDDSATADPGVVETPFDTISYHRYSGKLIMATFNAQFKSIALGRISGSRYGGIIFGQKDSWQDRTSIAETGMQIATDLPAYGLYETDQLSTSNNRYWFSTLNSGIKVERKGLANLGFRSYRITTPNTDGSILSEEFWNNKFILSDSTSPQLIYNRPTNATNEKLVGMGYNLFGNNWAIYNLNDVGTTRKNYIEFARAGDTPVSTIFRTRLVLGTNEPTLTLNNTTPSVKYSSEYMTANTNNTTLTFLADGAVGQIIIITVRDNKTTFKHDNPTGGAGKLYLKDRQDYKADSLDVITLKRGDFYWHEIARSAKSIASGNVSIIANGLTTVFTLTHNFGKPGYFISDLAPTNFAGAIAKGLGYYYTNKTANTFDIVFLSAPATGTLSFDYVITRN